MPIPLRAALPLLVISLAACSKNGGPCDLEAPDCDDGFACVADDDEGVCIESCDPVDPSACGNDAVCDAVTGGGFACFEPVVMEGVVFDASDESPIEGASVLAADRTGIAVTTVAVTDELGAYHLDVPVERDGYGVPATGTFTLRVSAQDYQPYPAGIRPAIPIDAASATQDGDHWLLMNTATNVALIALPAAQQGRPSIAGTVVADIPRGTLVVAECAAPPCPFSYADLDGRYVIHNVADGAYTVRGYRAQLQLEPAEVTVAGQDVAVDLTVADAPLASVSGTVNIVNAPGGSQTSVVLIPSSTFVQLSPTFVRGEVGPGLRSPLPGIEPDVTGAYTVVDVPNGTYKVLAAFENDGLIRDPDPGIAGTQIVEITVPDPSGTAITIGANFKVTEALAILSPGATGPEPVDPGSPPDLVFAQDSGEQSYDVVVYDAFGNAVWTTNVPAPSGSAPVSVPYGGPPLVAGMYYQFRAISLNGVPDPLSTTEDLLGVFYAPAE